jgi:hypothetical protein
MKKWLKSSTVRSRLSDSEVTYLINEVDKCPVALSGNGIVVINYELASSVRIYSTCITLTFIFFVPDD